MPRTKDYQKLSAKLQEEVAKLKKQIDVLKKENKNLTTLAKTKVSKSVKVVAEWLDEEFEKGYEAAYEDMDRMQDAFDEHMKKAAIEFEDEFAKSVAEGSKTKKKAKAKTKSKPKSATKKRAPAKKRGRPAKK